MNKAIFKAIWQRIKEDPQNVSPYEDMFSAIRIYEEEDLVYSHGANASLRKILSKQMQKKENVEPFFDLYKRTLLFDAPYDLDSYLLYLEMKRPPEKRFYQPRRAVLKQVVDALQDLTEDKLDELFLSMPPRVGKSTLMIFFMTWLMGRNSENPNLYTSYTAIITESFYSGVMEVLTDKDTYLWQDVFPEHEIARTDAKDATIDIDRRKHYPTLTCRSIEGTINGACDAQDGFIIADDLVSGIEEALSKDRLVTKWNKVDNNLIPRGKGKTKYLWIGTRWSLFDPTGVRMNILQSDEKYKDYRFRIINLPALNENDESNFDYPYGVGFDTLYYQRRRASFERNNDLASWLAQYQGEPIERQGTLFEPGDFTYYNGVLPEEEPDRIFTAVDPAFGGGDFVAAPICYQYGDKCYVHDVVYDNHDKRITQNRLVDAVKRHNISAMQIEANKSTEAYKEGVDALLREEGIRINMTTKAAPPTQAKHTRIIDKAPDIRENMVFIESGKRSREYEAFMQNVFNFRIYESYQKNKKQHEDAPDSLAMAMDMMLHPKGHYTVFKRPF